MALPIIDQAVRELLLKFSPGSNVGEFIVVNQEKISSALDKIFRGDQNVGVAELRALFGTSDKIKIHPLDETALLEAVTDMICKRKPEHRETHSGRKMH